MTNLRAALLQSLIFIVEWGLMFLGFGIISRLIAPATFLSDSTVILKYLDAAIKALLGLLLSLAWLLIWDRQVRFFFYRRRARAT